ncbi:MAG TPA: serpin family protein [Pyrinomonadaceae bacterium]|nr:serpin family protein [Pyrinomonadaceae bacterium]
MIHLHPSDAKALVLAMVVCFMAAPVQTQPNANSARLETLREQSPQQAAQKFNQALVKGNTQFGLNLYDTLRLEEGNIFFSPYSISSALAMTYLGARGETANQMASVLRLPADQEEATRAFAVLNKALNGQGENRHYQLDVANALWGAKGVGFLDSFLKAAQDAYDAGLKEMDFVRDAEGSRQTINDWVEQKTHEKIKNLMPPGSIDDHTRLVLTNAIYFKGAWLLPFEEKLTKQSDFTTVRGQKVTAPLMENTSYFLYLEEGDLQVVELPYAGNELSMLILLPRQVDGLAALEKSLKEEKLSAIESKLLRARVHVSLPRFKMTQSFQLTRSLQVLGMELPFTARADFSGMDGKKDLFISAAVHKAYVDVNEQGTEAAAASGVGMTVASSPPPPKEFRADHPFLFVIRHKGSDSLLFMGRVQNPLQ